MFSINDWTLSHVEGNTISRSSRRQDCVWRQYCIPDAWTSRRSSSSSSASKKTYSNPGSKSGGSVASYALQFKGNPYRYGGTSLTNGTDCSGFVKSVYKHFGVSLPRTSGSMRSVGQKVSTKNMMPGDIVCYSGHVALYMGDGKIIHASNPRDGIKISNNVFYRPVITVRRVL